MKRGLVLIHLFCAPADSAKPNLLSLRHSRSPEKKVAQSIFVVSDGALSADASELDCVGIEKLGASLQRSCNTFSCVRQPELSLTR